MPAVLVLAPDPMELPLGLLHKPQGKFVLCAPKISFLAGEFVAYVMPSLFFFFRNEIWVYDVISEATNPGLATVNSAEIVTVGFFFN